MAAIRLENVSKIYPSGVRAVEDVSLHIRDGEFMILLGPSGCGKSTTLRMIAGLESISSGEVYIKGELANEIDPRDRNLAFVFQNYALYPHMTVAANLSFGLRLRHAPQEEIARRVAEASSMLGIGALLDRKPSALSGGQRQRVALGRALVRDPVAFLLDEPLSNLDAKLRAGMRRELVKLHRTLGRTIVHVTHDQVEAMTMGERICIMNEGRIVQVGRPLEVYRNPANLFVAGFLASPPMNLLQARISMSDSRPTLQCGRLSLPIPSAYAPDSMPSAGHAGRARHSAGGRLRARDRRWDFHRCENCRDRGAGAGDGGGGRDPWSCRNLGENRPFVFRAKWIGSALQLRSEPVPHF